MNKIRRQAKRFGSPFVDENRYDETIGRGYFLEPHGRFHGQRIGGQRLNLFKSISIARDFWYRDRVVKAPIDHRLTKGLDRYGAKFFGVPSRQAVQVDRVASKSLRKVQPPDNKTTLLLRVGDVIETPGNGADFAMEFGRVNQFRTAGCNRPPSKYPTGEVKFIGLDTHPYSWRLGYFRFAGIPLEKKPALQLRRGRSGRFGIVSIAGSNPPTPNTSHDIRRPDTFGHTYLHGRDGKVVRFPIPFTTEIPASRVTNFSPVIQRVIRTTGGNFGSVRFGNGYRDQVKIRPAIFKNILSISRRPNYSVGAYRSNVIHPLGEPLTLPGIFRNVEAPPADRMLASARGTRLSSIPRPLGEPWTFPFKFRFIESIPAIRKLADSRGSRIFSIPHPEGIYLTDPWRMRIVRIHPALIKILDRVSGSRRWGSSSKELFDATDYTRIPVYIDIVWNPEEIIEIRYEPNIDIDLEVA